MASNYYWCAQYRMMLAGLNITTQSIWAYLVDTGLYTFDAAHNDVSNATQFPVASLVATIQLTNGKAVNSAGTFDADDVTFTNVTGNSTEAIVIYDNGTLEPIAYLDGGSVTLVPNGNNVDCHWHASGIFGFVTN